MRHVTLSLTYQSELEELLVQGALRFGARVASQKRDQVTRAIESFLARHPVRPIDPVVGLWTYPVSKTPFVLIYDFDDAELRIHLIIHESADRTAIDLSRVAW